MTQSATMIIYSKIFLSNHRPYRQSNLESKDCNLLFAYVLLTHAHKIFYFVICTTRLISKSMNFFLFAIFFSSLKCENSKIDWHENCWSLIANSRRIVHVDASYSCGKWIKREKSFFVNRSNSILNRELSWHFASTKSNMSSTNFMCENEESEIKERKALSRP